MKKFLQSIKRSAKKSNAVYMTKTNEQPANSLANINITKQQDGFEYPSAIFTLK